MLQAPGASLTTGATNVITVAPWMIGPGTWVTEVKTTEAVIEAAAETARMSVSSMQQRKNIAVNC